MVEALARIPAWRLRHRSGEPDRPARPAAGGDAPLVVSLDDPLATDPGVAGRKAATLAMARRLGFPVLPGFVVTTTAAAEVASWGAGPGAATSGASLRSVLEPLWSSLSEGGERPLVVRSSSPGEDGERSSMAGQFTSVLGVRGYPAFVAAVRRVVASALVAGGGDGLGEPPPMAVLVQPQVFPAWGGVLFGIDPVTGRADRLVVAAVRGGPDELVGGAVDGARWTLSLRGRVLEGQGGQGEALGRRLRRELASLAARSARAFGSPQDVEWAVGDDGGLLLLQARPVTATGVAARARGPLLGPGPVAETFPDPLSPLEEDLWLAPLRVALGEAVVLTGAAPRRRVTASPVVASVRGRVAADLQLLGMVPGRRSSLLVRLDPRPPARRLWAAWRTGRLRAALPGLAGDVVRRVDDELDAVPAPGRLGDADLVAVLRGSHQALVAVHGYEVLAGMLSAREQGAPTSAAAALRALAAGRAEGLDDEAIVARHPVVLALVPPAVGGERRLPAVLAQSGATPGASPVPVIAWPAGGRGPDAPAAVPAGAPSVPVPAGRVPAGGRGPDAPAGLPAGDLLAVRETLRLRARWVQELTAVVAAELGRRLARRGLLADAGAVRWLRLDELEAALVSGAVPGDVEARQLARPEPPLPAAFRLGLGGAVVAAGPAAPGAGHGAGGGRAVGRVTHDTAAAEPGDVLVVRTLDPGLAAALPGLGALVAETGSVLSHLAILARELGVPTVVGVVDALDRFPAGSVAAVDGTTGEVGAVGAHEAAT